MQQCCGTVVVLVVQQAGFQMERAATLKARCVVGSSY